MTYRPQPPPNTGSTKGGTPGTLGPFWRIAVLVLAGAVFSAILLAPYDDSDTADARSGLSIHRDALTGCEYLSRWGSLTPRLDRSGKHVCR